MSKIEWALFAGIVVAVVLGIAAEPDHADMAGHDHAAMEMEATPNYDKQYGSPTILVDEQGSESDFNCCRVYTNADGRFQGMPTVEKIVAALQGGNGSGCC